MDNQQPSFKIINMKKNAQKYIIKENTQYGQYLTLKLIERKTKKGVEFVWKVKHLISGTIQWKRGAYLYHATIKYNELKNTNTHQLGLRGYLYRTSWMGAKHRGHEYNLSKEEYDNLTMQNCYYCGAKPSYSTNDKLKKRGNVNQPPFAYNGVDRLNSKIGYTIENCVPCCKQCNIMKNIYTVDEFLNKATQIYLFNLKKGSTTIPKGSTLKANVSGKGEHLNSKAEDEDIV